MGYKRLLDLPSKSDTFEFNVPDSWVAFVWESLNEFGAHRILKEFVADPPEYIVGDNLSWLDRTIYRATSEYVDSKVWFLEKFKSQYSCVRCFHGTRTDQVNQFYLEGLLALNSASARENILRIFSDAGCDEITEVIVDKAMSEVGLETRENRVYFNFGEEFYPEEFGHYLLYGGEFICAVAAHFPGARDYRQCLKKIGLPTLFVCDVPIAMISEYQLLGLAGSCLSIAFQMKTYGEDFCFDNERDFSVSIATNLPPSAIKGHYHPTNIRDPFSSIGRL